jgi:hypothetical protein
MTKAQVLREALSRLYVIRETKSPNSNKTREEDWLESLIRLLINYSADSKVEIPVDLELLQLPTGIFNALLDRIEENEKC